jgi:tRNA 5-methylaminomethyl-2-thiouridine biosynthesis bifunctional protein
MQFTKLTWHDGQPYSELFDDIYYSSDKDEDIPGENEFKHVFFRHNGLPQRWFQRDDFVIAELGFGSGLNCILTIREWLKHCAESKQKKTLHYIAIDKHPLSANDIVKLISRYAELKQYCDELVEYYPPAIEATHCRSLFENRVIIHFKFMDVEDALDDAELAVDAWYLDGFSPAKNPHMWSQHLFSKIAYHSRAGATCSTYTAAGMVKRNLQKSGFLVEKVSGYGKKREMLAAKLPDDVTNDMQAALSYKDKPWFQRPKKKAVSEKTATIIGAGIAGLSMAHALIGRGWKVTIIDRHGDICKQASSNPAPIVYPRLSVDNDVDAEYFTTAYCHALYVLRRLQKKCQQRFWHGDGLLQMVDRRWIQKILKKFQLNSDYLLIVDDPGGDKVTVEFKSAGVVLPDILCAVLKSESGSALNIIEADITALDHDGGKWQCLQGSELIREDEVLIVANGIAINETGLPVKFPVESVRGQVAVLNTSSTSSTIKKTLNSEVHITPMINGKHYLGATYTRNNTSSAVERNDDLTLLEALDRIYPDMFDEDDCSTSWVGFRTISKDRVPIVGAVPDMEFFNEEYSDIRHGNNNRNYRSARYKEGLYVSAAHGSRGFTGSFISAEIIASLIEGSPLPVNKKILDYLNPSRFVVNDLKRR